MRQLAVALLTILSVACASTPSEEYTGPINQQTFTLAVENLTGTIVSFYIGGRKVGAIDGSRDGCLTIPSGLIFSGGTRITFRIMGEPTHTVTFNPFLSEGWFISLGPWPNRRAIDLLSLQPAGRCDVHGKNNLTQA